MKILALYSLLGSLIIILWGCTNRSLTLNDAQEFHIVIEESVRGLNVVGNNCGFYEFNQRGLQPSQIPYKWNIDTPDLKQNGITEEFGLKILELYLGELPVFVQNADLIGHWKQYPVYATKFHVETGIADEICREIKRRIGG